MKYKVGDKVKVVKPEGVGSGYNGMIGYVKGFQGGCYEIEGVPLIWYDSDLELLDSKESIFDKLAHSIAEAAKEANILVEPTEDGGIKISPLEVKEDDLGIGTPCMVSDDGNEWGFSFYAGNKRTFSDGFKWNKSSNTFTWLYIIEFSKFNPNNIEESLKYNIVK